MSNIVGTVVSVDLNTQVSYAPPKQGSYPGWQLIYKDEQGQVKTIAKHASSLKNNPSLAAQLNGLVSGDVFTALVEKNGKYNEIVGIEKGSHVASLPNNTPPTGGKVTGSNYETREERTARQRLIVRQSSLAQAIEYFELTKGKPNVEDVKTLADEFTDFIFEVEQGVQ